MILFVSIIVWLLENIEFYSEERIIMNVRIKYVLEKKVYFDYRKYRWVMRGKMLIILINNEY